MRAKQTYTKRVRDRYRSYLTKHPSDFVKVRICLTAMVVGTLLLSGLAAAIVFYVLVGVILKCLILAVGDPTWHTVWAWMPALWGEPHALRKIFRTS